jgi:hypothetical protein
MLSVISALRFYWNTDSTDSTDFYGFSFKIRRYLEKEICENPFNLSNLCSHFQKRKLL